MVGIFVIIEIAVKQYIMVDVALGVFVPRNQPRAVHKLLFHRKRRRNGSRRVTFGQIILVDDFA